MQNLDIGAERLGLGLGDIFWIHDSTNSMTDAECRTAPDT
jgi:hypothetical protein